MLVFDIFVVVVFIWRTAAAFVNMLRGLRGVNEKWRASLLLFAVVVAVVVVPVVLFVAICCCCSCCCVEKKHNGGDFINLIENSKIAL